MANPILALLAIALVGSVGAAGVMLHAADTSPGTITVTGKVVAVEWNPHFNVSVEFELYNSTSNATYHVEVGPPWYWAEHALPAIKVNDTVKVQGVLEGSELEAWTIWINGGSAIVLRTGEMPPWAQERSGHTPDTEHDNETED